MEHGTFQEIIFQFKRSALEPTSFLNTEHATIQQIRAISVAAITFRLLSAVRNIILKTQQQANYEKLIQLSNDEEKVMRVTYKPSPEHFKETCCILGILNWLNTMHKLHKRRRADNKSKRTSICGEEGLWGKDGQVIAVFVKTRSQSTHPKTL